jgi:hypothetical protein
MCSYGGVGLWFDVEDVDLRPGVYIVELLEERA